MRGKISNGAISSANKTFSCKKSSFLILPFTIISLPTAIIDLSSSVSAKNFTVIELFLSVMAKSKINLPFLVWRQSDIKILPATVIFSPTEKLFSSEEKVSFCKLSFTFITDFFDGKFLFG